MNSLSLNTPDAIELLKFARRDSYDCTFVGRSEGMEDATVEQAFEHYENNPGGVVILTSMGRDDEHFWGAGMGKRDAFALVHPRGVEAVFAELVALSEQEGMTSDEDILPGTDSSTTTKTRI